MSNKWKNIKIQYHPSLEESKLEITCINIKVIFFFKAQSNVGSQQNISHPQKVKTSIAKKK